MPIKKNPNEILLNCINQNIRGREKEDKVFEIAREYINEFKMLEEKTFEIINGSYSKETF